MATSVSGSHKIEKDHHYGLRSHYNSVSLHGQVLTSTKLADQPSIQWIPSRERYLEGLSKSAVMTRNTLNLPSEFPPTILGDRVWTARDFVNPQEYVVQLSSSDIEEAESALQYFKELPGMCGPQHVSKSTFPLLKLGKILENISHAIHYGRGFAILRGLEPSKYNTEDNMLMYLGLTSYIGEKRGCQDPFGNMIGHVKDMGSRDGLASRRHSRYTQSAQPFHNDLGDIICMYSLTCANVGGASLMASSATVYNEISALRPDLLSVLAEPSWVFDKCETPTAWKTRALLFPEPTHGPFLCCSRRKLTGSPDFPLSSGLPRMTSAQEEALEMVHFTADKHALKVQLQQGDIQFLSNLAVLHAREAFASDADQDQSRHLVRLWLRNEDLAWQTPQGLAANWWEVYGNSERMKKAKWQFDSNVKTEHIIERKMTC